MVRRQKSTSPPSPRKNRFGGNRALVVGSLLLIGVQAAALAGLFLRDRVPGGGLGPTDYVSFQAAAAFAWAGVPQQAYDAARHLAAERALVPTLQGYVAFFYPPIFLLILAPLGSLPYFPAFLVWSGARLAIFFGALSAIVKDPARLLPLAAMPSVLMMDLWHGQNGMLSAALYAGGTVLLERRPLLAGGLLGALCYKPQLAILVPVALLAGRHWRAIAAAATTILGLATVSAALFGPSIWSVYFETVAQAPNVFLTGQVDYAQMASLYAAARSLGAPAALAAGLQAAASLGAAIAVALVWGREPPPSIRAPVLLAGAVVAAPVVLPYDLAIVIVALAWIWNDARARGWRSWEKMALLALFLGPQIAKTIAVNAHVALLPLVTLGLFALALDRARGVPAPDKRLRGVDGSSRRA
jgi:hypothetical protein